MHVLIIYNYNSDKTYSCGNLEDKEENKKEVIKKKKRKKER